MAAACARAEMLRADDAEQGAAAYELADAFCEQARLRVDALFDALWSNTDDDDVDAREAGARRRVRVARGRRASTSEGTGPWIAPWQEGPSQAESVARRYLPSTREG